ncbi:hypothetical protein H311_00480 [Anncaliia algerae PRA109]|nr:hypothetical protein H311_00480 [Anncaliia algerae PRA109]
MLILYNLICIKSTLYNQRQSYVVKTTTNYEELPSVMLDCIFHLNKILGKQQYFYKLCSDLFEFIDALLNNVRKDDLEARQHTLFQEYFGLKKEFTEFHKKIKYAYEKFKSSSLVLKNFKVYSEFLDNNFIHMFDKFLIYRIQSICKDCLVLHEEHKVCKKISIYKDPNLWKEIDVFFSVCKYFKDSINESFFYE